MPKQYWTLTEVVEYFDVDERFLRDLESEEIVRAEMEADESARTFCMEELEKLRLAKILVEDMEVNLPGIEVILRMRQNMLDMRRQFDAILEDVNRHLRGRFPEDF